MCIKRYIAVLFVVLFVELEKYYWQIAFLLGEVPGYQVGYRYTDRKR